ncbi:hypothetical protein E8E14_013836 [Neopestalotiopsis sp. 37M]|nr:hypothetical protein E8E14_013836 [Neopestalotiopsis sp. 37M]
MADSVPVTSPGPLLSDLWEHHGAPTDQEVLDHITQTDEQHTPIETDKETTHTSGADHCKWESPPNHLCSASFGDRGMTATVNAYGLLMQFGDYLGVGSLNIEWMVHEKTLLQKCVVENTGSGSCDIEMSFLKDLRIRDLDHTGNYADPKLITGTLGCGPGPSQYTWLWQVPYTFERSDTMKTKADGDGKSHDNNAQSKQETKEENEGLVDQKPGSLTSNQVKNQADAQSISPLQPTKRLQYFELRETPESPLKIAPRPAATEDFTPTDTRVKMLDSKTTDPFTVVVVAAVFVNGEPKKFESQENPLSPSNWALIWNEQSQSEPERQRRLEIVTAYQMLLVPSAHTEWKDLIIPAKDVDMELFLNKDAVVSTQLFPFGLSDVPLPFSTSNVGGQMLDSQSATKQSTTARYDALNSNESLQKMKRLSGLPTHSSPAGHLNYAMWRNLEHILSVCSIHIGPRMADQINSEIEPIALTCGDMSLHRVCNSASFFALQFLLETAKNLAHSTDKSRDVDQGNAARLGPHHTKETAFSMKKSFPLGSSLDSSKIIDVDEEWLYDYPTFFQKSDNSPGFDELSTLIEEDKVASRMFHGGVEILGAGRPTFGDGPFDSAVKVIDVSKQKHVGKRGRRHRDIESDTVTYSSRKELWSKLAAKRTAEDAKKRLIFLISPKIEENLLICYLTTPLPDRAAIDSFFSRHTRSTTYFHDHTSKIYNWWTSEILFDIHIPPITRVKAQQDLPLKPHATDLPMSARACLGLRFEGDIFDRHWTCYLLGSRDLLNHPSDFEKVVNVQRDWRQRKVLELCLLSLMLAWAVQMTERLLRNLTFELKLGVRSFNELSSDEYIKTSHKRLQGTQELLEAIDVSLTGIFEIMARWDNRERDRTQQPRWTRNDERKYRESINGWRIAVENDSLNLRRAHADAKALRDKVNATLTRNLANIAEGRSLRESENMQLFTYVTVVFLPLGFAASIFSMGGTPDTPLVVNMVIFAIVALFLTIVMLINAKRLATMAKEASHAIHEYSKAKMEESFMVRHHTPPRDEGHLKKHRTEIDQSWFLWFWVKYLFAELPARRVVVACRLLNLPQSNAETFLEDTHSPAATSSAQGDTDGAQSSASGDSETAQSSPKQWVVWQVIGTLRVLGGLVFAPLFVTSWAIQLIALNLLDLFRLVRNLLVQLAYLIPAATIDAAPEIWLTSQEQWRPIKRLDQYIHGDQTDGQE